MDHNQASITDHEEVAKVLRTSLTNGLTSFEARERLKKYGQNNLQTEQTSNIVNKYIFQSLLDFLKQFLNPLIQLLLICVVVSAAIGEYESAISVAISILIVCTISYIQERKADKSLEKLNKRLPNLCKVIREGQTHEIESQFLVPGDIVILNEGQRIPADVRLFDLHSLSLNESNLTGETQAQVKSLGSIERAKSIFEPSLIKQKPQEEKEEIVSNNLALMGTIVESGHSKGIVFSTGTTTRYGEVFGLLNNIVHPKSPLQLNIDQLSIHLVIIACFVIALLSIIGIIQQRPMLELAFYAVSLAVTAIPEGLPVVVAVIMALGVIRLSKQKTIVKSLNSIETLGCIQILCADKTGTLTQNEMTLTDIVTSELHSLSSSELEDLNNEECRKHMTFNNFGGKMYSIGRLMEVGTLCNNASYNPSPPEGCTGHYIGQSTECAILDAAIRLGFGDSRTKFDRLSERPFSSSSRRMAVHCQRLDLPGNSPMWYVKGAWEEILEDCTHYYECGLVKPRSNEMWLEYARVCTTLGSQGLRVLALATGQRLEQLTFVGVVGINNAPRVGITDTLEKLRNDFHIDIKMITGDSRATATAVGSSLGLIEGVDIEDKVMSGEQLQELLKSELVSEQEKAEAIKSKAVFYRVDAIQKANIVSKLQELDQVVAMTGDGVNDVVSLKRANLSLSMGTGADVCKEVADVIIVDNDLSVLVPAVVEGKGIHLKIQNFMSYQISISLSLLLLVAISFATRNESPFTVIQLLFINLLTDGPPAQSLGMERVHLDDLDLRPRNVHEPLLSYRLFGSLLILTSTLTAINGCLYEYVITDGQLDDHDRSLLFTCFVFCSIFSVVSLRSKIKTVFEMNLFSNKELVCCCSVVAILQVILIQVDPINKFFEADPLNCLEFVYLFLYSSLVLIVMDSAKLVLRALFRLSSPQ